MDAREPAMVDPVKKTQAEELYLLTAAAKTVAEEIDRQSDNWAAGSGVDFAAIVDACRSLRRALGMRSPKWGDDK